MVEVSRPDCCPDATCRPLEVWPRICCGDLARPLKHNDLLDTLCFCLEGEPIRLNTADVYYFCSALIAGLQHEIETRDYNPCAELGIADPVRRLITKLEAIKT